MNCLQTSKTNITLLRSLCCKLCVREPKVAAIKGKSAKVSAQTTPGYLWNLAEFTKSTKTANKAAAYGTWNNIHNFLWIKNCILSFEERLPVQNGLEVRLPMPSATIIKIIILHLTSPVRQSYQAWLNGLVVWFLLRVQEVPGSNPGWAPTFFYFKLIINDHN